MTSGAVLAPSVRPLDAHLHVWDLAVNGYPWLRPEHGVLYDSFPLERALSELEAAGVGEAVLVQAEDSAAETRYLLDVARSHDMVRGVVGWVPLDDPEAAAGLLEGYGQEPLVVGLRQLIHDHPRADLLESGAARRTLARVAEASYPVDVPDAWPRHLAQVEHLAAELPDLVLVVDHLGKPPRGRADLGEWRQAMARVAAHENVVAKLSGLHVPDEAYTAAALGEVWAVALELFGPRRLLYGSDWPMTVPHGGYGATYEVLLDLIVQLSPSEQALVAGDNARRVYRLADRADEPAPRR